VLALLVVNLVGGGGGGNPTPPPAATEAPTYTPYDYDIFAATPEPDDGEDVNNILYKAPTAPPATPMPAFSLLKKGSSGPEVERLQERLKLLGYLPADSVVDGKYGQETANAVKEFQRKAGLSADGDAGPLTQTKLFSIVLDAGDTQPGGQDEEPVNQPG